MSITVETIARLLSANGSTVRGEVIFYLEQARKPNSGTPKTRELLTALATPKASRTKVTHPLEHATREQYRRDNDDDLSPVELMWLQRLSLDPTKVSFPDAARLAALAQSISPMQAPASARLIDSIWGPVKAVHDRRIAEEQRANAAEPLTRIPSVAIGAIAELLEQQNAGLDDLAIASKAREVIASVSTQREDRHSKALARADRDLKELADRKAQRENSSLTEEG